MSIYRHAGKRVLDICLTIFGILLAAPTLCILALIIRAKMGTPIIFAHHRIGKGGQEFTLLKLRTMTDTRDSNGRLLPDADRLTSLGRLLRSTSLDELPELINIWRGEMSWVGPRPLLPQYLERYTPNQMRRHEVKPGLTGWAQVNGRNAITWEAKFALDVWYVDHMSFWIDLKILALTVVKVIRREGISQEGYDTMPEFMGTPYQE